MKTKKLLETLVLAACCTGSAQAAVISLQNAIITGTYNGQASGMLGADHSFDAVPGSNITHLDSSGGAEFINSDFTFQFDFDASGNLTVQANQVEIPSGAYVARFDFGVTLPANIGSFTLTGNNGTSGMPLLSVINAHTIELDLSNISWGNEFGSFTAQIAAADGTSVPEPGSVTLLVAGLAGLAAVRRSRTRRS